MLPSGRQTYFTNRLGWASTYLKKAGLITSPVKATFVITDEGRKVLAENVDVIDANYLMKFPSFRKFQNVDTDNIQSVQPKEINDDETPDDAFEDAFRKINKSLSDDLLSEIMKLTPEAFEKMVLDLMRKMGYGTFENAAHIYTALYTQLGCYPTMKDVLMYLDTHSEYYKSMESQIIKNSIL